MSYTEDEKKAMRLAIAKDVIEQIKAKRFVATSGTYYSTVEVKDEDKRPAKNLGFKTQMQSLTAEVKTCNVCALGAVFVSAVDKFDKLELGDMFASRYADAAYGLTASILDRALRAGQMTDHLTGFFEMYQLTLIEAMFEDYAFCTAEGEDWTEYINSFHEKYTNEEDRLIGIMERLIAQDGTISLSEDDLA